MPYINTIVHILYAISVGVVSTALGIALASYGVLPGIEMLEIKLSPTMRKLVVFSIGILAGFLGLILVLLLSFE